MPLDPQIKQIIDDGDAWDAVHGPVRGADAGRARIAHFRTHIWKPEFLPVASIRDAAVPGPAGEIPIRIYRPLTGRSGARHGVPTVVFFHGGGFTSGGLDSHESHARRISNRVGAVVVSVDYRLAPEHKFPAGYDDCAAAYRWVAGHSDDFGGDAGRIAVAGDSAGANFAAGTALIARDEGLPLAAHMLIYPAVDLATVYRSTRELASGYFLEVNPEGDDWSHYLEPSVSKSDPRVSPLFADLRGVAPAVVAVAEFDPVKDQGTAYADKLEATGADVAYRSFDGLIHSFMNMGAADVAVEASNTLCDDLAGLLGVRR